jgi:YVTN family beta-propeller protein
MTIAACLVALGAAPASAATLTHWWKADGNANDFVAANNGSLAGDAGFVTGFSGQAFSFDGNGDYVNVPEAASHYSSGSFTVDAWVKSSVTQSGTAMIASAYECGGASCGTAGNEPPDLWQLYLADGKAKAQVRDHGATGTTGGQSVTGGAVLTDGAFHHVAVIRDVEAGKLALYVDGIQVANDDLGSLADGPLQDGDAEADPLLIGASATTSTTTPLDFFNGTIDDVRFWDGAVYPDASRPRTAYVINESSHNFIPINLADNTPGPAFPLGGPQNPFGIAITPSGSNAYIVTAGSNATTSPVTLFSGTVGAAIGGGEKAVAISPDGTKAYAANGNTLTPITIATNAAGTPITIDPVNTTASANAIAITPDGTKAYVATGNGGGVSPIDLVAGTAGTSIPMGSDSRGIAITPDGSTVYVANSDISSVKAISTATNTVVATIGVGSIPNAVAVAPDGKTAYVTNQGGPSVTPIDTATNTAGAPITVGSSPHAIAIAGNTAYVANGGDDDVSTIDRTTNTRGATDIPVGDFPRGIAIVPSQGPTAAFSSSPQPTGSASGFDGSSSSDTDGTVARYDWDFGDGTVVPNGGAAPTHTYASAGSFTVKLTVTDDGGCSKDFVFTGQTAQCLASPAAEISHQVDVQAAAAPPTSGTTTTAPAPTGQRAAALKKCKKKRNPIARKKCKKKARLLPL